MREQADISDSTNTSIFAPLIYALIFCFTFISIIVSFIFNWSLLREDYVVSDLKAVLWIILWNMWAIACLLFWGLLGFINKNQNSS